MMIDVTVLQEGLSNQIVDQEECMKEKALEEKKKQDQKTDLKVGEGFSDARGYFPEGPMVKNNGLNINNEPRGAKEREKEKQKRR